MAAELTQDANDLQQLDPMVQATAATLAAAGIAERPEALLADSGYWSIANLTRIPDAPELLIPPARHARQGKPRTDGKPSASNTDGLCAVMTAKLASDEDMARHAMRKQTVELVRPDLRTSTAPGGCCAGCLAACEAEWKLLRHPPLRQAVAPLPPQTGTQADRRVNQGERQTQHTRWLASASARSARRVRP